MNRLGFILLCAVLLLAWPGRICFAQFYDDYYDYDPYADAMMEAEALIEALDEFGLELDSPELEDMDGGDIWSYIENLRMEKSKADRDSGDGKSDF